MIASDDGSDLSEIQQFFHGTNVFITGATGFIGNVFVEKLLRACLVNKLYLLVRAKKNKNPQDRIREMFNTPLFNVLREEQPDFIDKVLLITGDCVEPNLGLSAVDEEFIVANMDIVVHCAATINLNGPIKHTSFINVRSTRDLLLIAQRMHKLKSFVYVSTAFSNPNQSLIEEKIYDCHMNSETLISMVENMSDSLLNSITSQCLGTWPNTYTLSKCIAENVVKQYGQNMPICITRPCIVMFTQEEPIPGWTSNIKSVPGLCLGIGLGAIHVAWAKKDCCVLAVPGDKVANLIITSVWHASKTRSERSIPVFNYVPGSMAPPITYGKASQYIIQTINEHKFYSEKEVWKPSLFFANSEISYTILFFLFHYIPAYIADICLWIAGKKLRVTKIYKKVDTMMREMNYFGVTEFNIDDKNMIKLMQLQSSKDKSLFNFDLSDIKWKEYFAKNVYGIRRYMLNEFDNLTAGQKRHQKIMAMYYILNTLFYGGLLYLFYGIFNVIVRNN